MTQEELFELAGKKKNILMELAEFMYKNYGVSGEIKFSKKYGWNIFWRKSGKSLAIGCVNKDKFEVTVVVGNSLENKIVESGISKKCKEKFDSAKVYFDGRWLNYPEVKAEELEDIKKLILVKKKPIIEKR